jgi:hypothetical protein
MTPFEYATDSRAATAVLLVAAAIADTTHNLSYNH